jgi:hypothetical protein
MDLPALARENLGQAIPKVKNFSDATSQFMDDVRDSYELSFDSAPATGAAANEFRSIDIIVDRPCVTVRTNTYHYAQP